MTQAPVGPTAPPDPQMIAMKLYIHCAAIVNARNPARAAQIMDDAAAESAERTKKKLDHMLSASGMREAPPRERAQLYTIKSQMEATHALWHAQSQEYPQDFEHDAIDAYKLGALLPPWVELEAIRLGARVK